MNPVLSVIAPCYNEEGNVTELTERLQAVFRLRQIPGEVVLVNDGSRDGTGPRLDHLASLHPNLRVVHHPVNRGMVAGWKSGLAASRGQFVCLIDSDLQNLPEDVGRLYREILHSGVDLVQGYRSSIGRLKDSRFFLSKGLNFLLNSLFGMDLRDNKSGFILCRREVLEEIFRYRFNYRHFQTFLLVAANHRGFKIREVETLFVSREVGRSFIPRFPVRLITQVLADLLLAWYEFRWSDRPRTVLGEFLAGRSWDPARATLRGWRRAAFSAYVWTMPLHGWTISRNVRVYYDELQRSQWLSPAEIRELQERKLRRLVHQAYYHVGYYRELFQELKLHPSDIRTLDDLRRLPLLDKATVRQRLHFDLLSDNHDKRDLVRISTSGSTGEPFVCYVDKFQLEMRWAATLRGMEWAGYRFGDRQVRLWHQTLGMGTGQIIREFLDAWMSRRLFIPAYEMSEANLPRTLRRMARHRPVLIDGYAESFNLLATYLRAHPRSDLRPRGVITSAQILPEQSRQAIEQAFGCPVFDKYGSREFSGIAWETEAHDGHLVVAENYIVEILCEGRPARPGETGEIVITDLNNFVMPFLRYRVGDLAVALDSSVPSRCGRGLPRLGAIEGRTQAIILGTNGNHVPGTFFAHLFKDYDHIVRQYQVIQEHPGAITLKIVQAARFTEAGFAEILTQLRRFLGQDMRFQLEFVDQIPLGRTGKHQGVISRLGIDFQQLPKSDPASDPGR